MVTIYEYNTLIEGLNSLFRQKQLNFSQISKACTIHPSYFSKVMKNKGSFSQSQIFKIGHILNLNDLELEYLLYLWSKNEAQSQAEKSYFEKKIRTIRNEQLKVSKKITNPLSSPESPLQKSIAEIYFAEALTAWIHMFLTIPDYQKNPLKILGKINISDLKLKSELKKLESLNLIKVKNQKIIEVQHSLHLDESSDISFLNHINWRLKAIQNIENRENHNDDYHLTVTFSADPEVKHLLKQLLRKTVLEAKSIVSQCPAQNEVYHLMMDLY